jgi:hypothetical protein
MVSLTRQQQQSFLVTSKPLSSVLLAYDYLDDVSGTKQYRIDRNLHISLISTSEHNKLTKCK